MASWSARRLGAEPLGETGLVRAFFGLPLPEPHRAVLDGYIAECASLAPDFRWTPAANLHLTVRFLGQVELRVAVGIAERVAATRPRSFEVRLGDVGVFKRGRLARVVWLGVVGGETEMAELAAVVEIECVREGLEPERRRFSAHLTLARARPRDGARPPSLAAPPDLPAWRPSELVLYRSHLGRGGSVYEPLQTVRLG
jgi:2'-5' RNA ligase